MAEGNPGDANGPRPAGHAALVERYDLRVNPNWHESLVATSGMCRVDTTAGAVRRSVNLLSRPPLGYPMITVLPSSSDCCKERRYD